MSSLRARDAAGGSGAGGRVVPAAKRNPDLWAGAVLAGLTLLRFWIAAAMPLSPDEAYYWVWSRALAPGYLDHPPMVALFTWLGTFLVGDTPLGIRLLGPFAAALGSVLLWDTTRLLTRRSDAGIVVAALVNAMPLYAIGASVMTPDTPLILFWTATLWALTRQAVTGDARWWLIAGLFTGLTMASKYTAAALAIGIVFWVAIAAREQLRRPAPYVAAIIAAAIFAPVLYWNAAHGWASFAKQGARVAAWQPARAGQFIAELIGGQLALITPFIFLLCAGGVVAAWRRTRRPDGAGWVLLACLSSVPALVMIQHAVGDRVQANWPAVVYPSAVVASALLCGAFWRRVRVLALVTGFAATAGLYLAVMILPPILPTNRDPIARQIKGWDVLAAEVDTARRAAGGGFVAVRNYSLAAELAYELPPDIMVVGIGPRWPLFALPRVRLSDQPGVSVTRRPKSTSGTSDTVVARRVGRNVIETYEVQTVHGSALGDVTLLPRPSIAAPRQSR